MVKRSLGTRSMIAGIVLTLAAGLVAVASVPASAQTVTVEARNGLQVQENENTLLSATFTYERPLTTITADVSDVSREKTQVGARIFYPGGALLELFTAFDGTQKHVLGQFTRDGVVAPVKVRARWDVEGDTVTFLLNRRNDPRRGNRRATFETFALTKGREFTGPICGPDAPRGCHDDWVQATVRR